MDKLLHGLHQFETEIHSINTKFFDDLSHGQSPQCIFITCSDSRVVPALLTTSEPGQLFMIRNAGNIVPSSESNSGEEASIEYGLEALGIKDIVVCGHSQCGAVKGLLNPESLGSMPKVAEWLKHAEDTKRVLAENYKEQDRESVLSIAIQENVLVQLEHLRQLPCVARRLWKREVELHGWVYQIETGRTFIYDPISEEFLPLVKNGDAFELGTK